MAIVDRRHSVSEGTAIKAPCRAATTANIMLAGEQSIDGVALLEGSRVLVKHQTDATQNGIYEVSTGNWMRGRDFDGAFDVVTGTVVRVTSGATCVGYWEVTAAGPIMVGSTALAFALTTSSIAGVSSFVQTLLDDTTAAAFLATLGVVPIPTGTVHAYAGATAPPGFLLTHGQAVSRTTYAALFAVLGATYGAGDGSTTFNLPDLRGRAIAGKDDIGGVSANRLLTGDLSATRHTLGGVGGTSAHTLTLGEMPSHSHTFTGSALPPHTHSLAAFQFGGGPGYEEGPNGATRGGATISSDSAGTPAGTNSSTGGGNGHNNVQPTIILNYIIKT